MLDLLDCIFSSSTVIAKKSVLFNFPDADVSIHLKNRKELLSTSGSLEKKMVASDESLGSRSQRSHSSHRHRSPPCSPNSSLDMFSDVDVRIPGECDIIFGVFLEKLFYRN